MEDWLEDENGNRCTVEHFGSIELAQEALDSLQNCKGCVNCKVCVNCKGCVYCEKCLDCENCQNCSYCEHCTNCMFCVKQVLRVSGVNLGE